MKRRRALQLMLFLKISLIVAVVACCGVVSRVLKIPFLWAIFCTGHSLQVGGRIDARCKRCLGKSWRVRVPETPYFFSSARLPSCQRTLWLLLVSSSRFRWIISRMYESALKTHVEETHCQFISREWRRVWFVTSDSPTRNKLHQLLYTFRLITGAIICAIMRTYSQRCLSYYYSEHCSKHYCSHYQKHYSNHCLGHSQHYWEHYCCTMCIHISYAAKFES